MTTTAQLPAVIDYLVTTAKVFPALAGVNVFDGPQPPAATQSLERVLWIGADPANADAVIGDGAQAWPNLDKTRTKTEDATLTCGAQHWSGDPSNKVHRDGGLRDRRGG